MPTLYVTRLVTETVAYIMPDDVLRRYSADEIDLYEAIADADYPDEKSVEIHSEEVISTELDPNPA